MIKKAKVSAETVRSFENAVVSAKDYSDSFSNGISALERLLQYLSEQNDKLSKTIDKLAVVKEELSQLIRKIEAIIADIRAQIAELEAKLAALKAKLAFTSPTITVSDSDGGSYQIPNPEYEYLEGRICAVEGEIAVLEEKLFEQERRLDKANEVEGKVSAHIDAINGVMFSISEKQNTCKQLMAQLGEIQTGNKANSLSASESLKKIIKLIDAYQRVKMVYEAGKDVMPGTNQNGRAINVTININTQNDRSNQNVTGYDESQKLDQTYIKEHNVKFDAENHICEVDGRKFGGKYNSYDERIKGTSKDNPILGHYEGARGESKYIPSNRSAAGIAVIEILAKKGLDGIEYHNGEPDFEPCAEAVVPIKNMTENREDYYDKNGESQLGNFSQADIELAKRWNFDERNGRSNWTPRDVLEYRKANKLSWHEKCDTENMVLVPWEINDFFKHIGGCSECRLRDSGNNEGGFDE